MRQESEWQPKLLGFLCRWCSYAGAGIVHRFGHQIGALTDCHHGLANAVVTLPLERYNEVEKLNGDKFIDI